MLTSQELQALTMLLNRTPMTHAEALWAHGLLGRLEQAVKANDEAAQALAGRPAA